MAGADCRSTKIPSTLPKILSTLPEEPSTPPKVLSTLPEELSTLPKVLSTPPKVLSTLPEIVPPTSARLAKGAECHIRIIAKRETIKSWREIVTAKHETIVSWHETKINMMKSKIEDS